MRECGWRPKLTCNDTEAGRLRLCWGAVHHNTEAGRADLVHGRGYKRVGRLVELIPLRRHNFGSAQETEICVRWEFVCTAIGVNRRVPLIVRAHGPEKQTFRFLGTVSARGKEKFAPPYRSGKPVRGPAA